MLAVGDPEVEVRISALLDDVAGVGGADGQDRRRAVGALCRSGNGHLHGRRASKDGDISLLTGQLQKPDAEGEIYIE